MFERARRGLTAWYLLIICAIGLVFSVIIYQVMSNEFARYAELQRQRTERRFYTTQISPFDQDSCGSTAFAVTIDPDLVSNIHHRLILSLFLFNVAILMLAGAVGYLLAGKTLHPISTMLTSQQRFISDASHELRTPLTSLKTAFEVSLRDPQLTIAEARQVIADSIQEVNALEHLTTRLLRLAQVSDASTDSMAKIQHQPVDLKRILQQAKKKITPQLTQKNIKLKMKLTPLWVRGNLNQLEQVCLILLDNAVKYSPTGSTVSVELATTDTATAQLAISDQGQGISDHDLPHIFDRFYRADLARTKHAAAGFGLGLAIAQTIIRHHRGAISVSSKLGKGSTFLVTLPIVQLPDQLDRP